MRNWEQLTDLANTEYQNEKYQIALGFYEAALESVDLSAKQLSGEPESTIAALTVSHLNLVSLYATLNKREMANRQFEKAMYALITLLSPKMPSEQVGHCTLKACNQINLEWANYINLHSEKMADSSIQRYIDANQALLSTTKQLTYKTLH